jgi:regulatory protein YycI of two-component signal transduction system YycFG
LYLQNNSSLSEKGQNLQYNLAFAKANLAADEVEVKNSIARLKEMDSLLHSSRKGARTASVDQLRQESSVLSDQSNEYKADFDEAEIKMAKDLQTHSATKIAEAKRLQIEEQDDQLLARVLDHKAAKVKVELR